MKDSTTQQLIDDYWYQNPRRCCTMCQCKCERRRCRGGNPCSLCIRDELTTRVGEEKANRFCDSVTAVLMAELQMLFVS